MMSSQRYKLNFRWLEQENGEKCIYDGDMLVGRLNEGPYPVCFHDLRLIPGGPVFIGRNKTMSPLGIAWRNQGFFNMAIDEITVDQKDSEHLKLYFKMHDTGLRDYRDPEYNSWQSAMQQETWLNLSYDGELSSYVFTIKSRLTVKQGGASVAKRLTLGLEFQDILPEGCFDRFLPHGDKKFSWFVYKGQDGHLHKLPHTHQLNQTKMDLGFCHDGLLAFVAEREYNPVIELTGKTGIQTKGHICFWAWDFHFFLSNIDIASLTPQAPLEVNYKIYSIPYERACSMLDEAKLSPVLDIPEVKTPVYVINGVNRFEPSNEYCQPCDGWFWQSNNAPIENEHKNDPNCMWDQKEGYKTPGSLSIHRQSDIGKSFWVFNFISANYPPHPPVSGKYRVQAMVKTKGVSGKVYLGWQFREWIKDLPGKYNVRGIECSHKTLKDDNEWQEISFETTDAGKAQWAGVYLIQEGKGKSWFDEVQVIPIRR